MQIVIAYPPNFHKIEKIFPIKDGVMFAWGDTIYNPSGVLIPESLIKHEEVHGARQGNDVERWWERYLIDSEFRLQEEIPAHQAEYLFIHQNANRQERRAGLIQIAARLSSPLYGNMIRTKQALQIIKEIL